MLWKEGVQHFVEAMEGDAVLLVAAQPMVARFERERGTLLRSAEFEQHWQTVHSAQHRFVFDREVARGGQFITFGRLGAVVVALENVFGHFGPQSPNEDTAGITQWNWQAAANEEALAANDAKVGGQLASGFLLASPEGEIGPGFGEPDIEGQPVMGMIATLADVSHGFCFRQVLWISKLCRWASA
jgi:hypothetical protein